MVALAVLFFYRHFSVNGLALSLNIVISIFLFAGLLMHGTPERYMRAIEESIRGIAGIVVQFPFYAGIMGMMVGANAAGLSLGRQVTDTFIAGRRPRASRCWPFSAPGWSTSSCPPAAASGRCRGQSCCRPARRWAWRRKSRPWRSPGAMPDQHDPAVLGSAAAGHRRARCPRHHGLLPALLVFSGVVIAGGLYS